MPGWLALNACGDGFWELDLLSGAAWYSDWFYRKLGWSEVKRSMLDLQPLLQPGCWDELMQKLRAQLEQGHPLDFVLQVQVADRVEYWQLRGSAQRNAAGQPIALAGSVREVSANQARPEPSSILPEPALACTSAAFDALPVAAALLDARDAILAANHKWRALAERATAQAIHCVLASGSTEEWLPLNHDGAPGSGPRPLRVRAAAFHHNGLPYLVVILDER